MMIIDINGNKRECVSVSSDKNWPGYLKVRFYSKLRKTYRDEWYPIDDFLKNNPNLSNLIDEKNKQPKEDLGVVSQASKQTLTDKTKNWQNNEFAGYPLWISRGNGEGQTRLITMNTDNTLIINKPWNTIPNKTSQYVISRNVHDPQVMGNTLPLGYKVRTKKNKKKKK